MSSFLETEKRLIKDIERELTCRPNQEARDNAVKAILNGLLHTYSVGYLLHLLAELWYESAEEAKKEKDETSYRLFLKVGGALEATGFGISQIDPPA